MATAKISGTRYELTGTGLTEGDQYAASIVYDPDGGAAGRNTGMSAQYVLDGGSVTFEPVGGVPDRRQQDAGHAQGLAAGARQRLQRRPGRLHLDDPGERLSAAREAVRRWRSRLAELRREFGRDARPGRDGRAEAPDRAPSSATTSATATAAPTAVAAPTRPRSSRRPGVPTASSSTSARWSSTRCGRSAPVATSPSPSPSATAPIAPTQYDGSPGFTGNHAVVLCGGMVYDPLADRRRRGIPQGPQKWPKALLRNACGRLNIAPPGTPYRSLGQGRALAVIAKAPGHRSRSATASPSRRSRSGSTAGRRGPASRGASARRPAHPARRPSPSRGARACASASSASAPAASPASTSSPTLRAFG